MSNLLLYVEENLLFYPELCYAKEEDVNSRKSGASAEQGECANAPLISPRSTLDDQCPGPPPGFTELTKPLTLETICEEWQDWTLTDSPEKNEQHPFTDSRCNTNPFLQDESTCDQNNLTPQKFIQLLKANLQQQNLLDSKILAAYLARVLNNSNSQTVDVGLPKFSFNENKLVDNAQIHFTENSDDTFVLLDKEADSTIDISQLKSSSPLPDCATNKNFLSSFCTNPFVSPSNFNEAETKSVGNTFWNVSSDATCPRQSNLNGAKGAFATLPNKSKVDESTRRETNPFKLSLAGKLRIPGTEEDNSENTESLHGLAFAGSIQTTLVATLSDTSWNNDSVSDPFSKTIGKCTTSPRSRCSNEEKNTEERQANSQGIAAAVNSFNVLEENRQDELQKSTNFLADSWLPINSFISPLITDSSNIDEGYLTRPSTTYNSHSSSPLIHSTIDVQCNRVDFANSHAGHTDNLIVTTNPPDSSNKQNFRPLLTTDYNVQSNVKRNYWLNDVPNTVRTDVLEFYNNSDHINRANDLRNIWKLSAFEEAKSNARDSTVLKNSISPRRLYFRSVDICGRAVHLFYYQKEGWLLTSEFIEAFTKFKSIACLLDLLDARKVQIPFREIQRSENMPEFLELNSLPLNVPRDSENNIRKIHLIPLKSSLKVLTELRIISQTDVDDAFLFNEFVKNSITHQIWMIVDAYRQFKRFIELPE